MMKLSKYSFGIGDRFAHQGEAQLKAIIKAKNNGINITPVWNKSNREHQIIGTEPLDTRKEADETVKALSWQNGYFVDADHINLSNVDNFIESSDFFTIDIADFIGQKAEKEDLDLFIKKNKKYAQKLEIPGIEQSFDIGENKLREIGSKFLAAIKEANKIYKHILKIKGAGSFIPEISMDEVDEPQTPVELFFILCALAQFGIEPQTIAPKFTGRFNKGVEYVGNLKQFEKEFKEGLLAIDYSIKEFNLPENLKLSVHSGSDKFAIYPVMGKLIHEYDKGIHIKTAGTTWLEELIGLAMAGGNGLEIAKEIYEKGIQRIDELTGPYSTVIDINRQDLPAPADVNTWNGDKFANTLRHIQENSNYNANFRQLLHVGYKIAAEMGNKYSDALKKHSKLIGRQVTENIYERHLKRLFSL